MRAGSLASRDDLVRHHRTGNGAVLPVPGRAQRVATFVRGSTTCDVPALAGDIATVSGLTDAEIGDQLGSWDPAYGPRLFPPPGLESVVVARDPADFHEFLSKLTGQHDMTSTSLGLTFHLGRSAIEVLSPIGYRAWFGESCEPDPRRLAFRIAERLLPYLSKERGVARWARLESGRRRT